MDEENKEKKQSLYSKMPEEWKEMHKKACKNYFRKRYNEDEEFKKKVLQRSKLYYEKNKERLNKKRVENANKKKNNNREIDEDILSYLASSSDEEN